MDSINKKKKQNLTECCQNPMFIQANAILKKVASSISGTNSCTVSFKKRKVLLVSKVMFGIMIWIVLMSGKCC